MPRVIPKACAAAAVIIAAAALAACGGSEQPYRIGFTWPCPRTDFWAVAGPGFFAALELPFLQRGARPLGEKPTDGVSSIEIGGRPVELVMPCTDGGTRDGLEEMRRLVEDVGVDAVISTGNLDDQLEYARAHPEVTFVGGGQDLRRPVANFTGWFPTQGTTIAGLATYVYEERGWRQVAVIGADTAANYEDVAYFTAEFCSLGGRIASATWTAPGEQDVAAIAASVPTDVDGFYVSIGNADVLAALSARVPELGERLAAGSFALTPPTPETVGPALEGAVGGGLSILPHDFSGFPGYDEIEAAFPGQVDEPSYAAGSSVHNQAEALVRALELVDGDPGPDQEALRRALREVTVEGLYGALTARVDEQGLLVTQIPVLTLQFFPDGAVAQEEFTKVYDVDQTLGGLLGPDTPPFGRGSQPCVAGNPPPWAEQS